MKKEEPQLFKLQTTNLYSSNGSSVKFKTHIKNRFKLVDKDGNTVKKSSIKKIKNFLMENAFEIQLNASTNHKKFLGDRILRSEFLDKYKKNHVRIVKELARNLEETSIEKGTRIFKEIGEIVAVNSVKDGLELREAIDGIIFLKQAFWELLERNKLLNVLTKEEFYLISMKISNYCDVVSSRIAFVYNEIYSDKITKELELKEKSERLLYYNSAIVDSSEDAIVSKNLDGIITSWNKGAENIFGWTAREVIGRHITIIIPKDHQKEEEEILKKLKRGISIQHFETIRITKKGKLLNISLSISPVKDSSGKIIGAAKIARDITKEKKAAEELEQSKRQLQIITNTVPVLISYVDKNERYKFVNKGYTEWFGHSQEDTVGRHLKEVVGDDAYLSMQPYVKKALKGEKVTYETYIPYKNGGTRYVMATYVPSVNKDNKVTGFYALVNDITKRKQAEEDLSIKLREQEIVTDLGLKALSGTELRVLMNDAVLKLKEVLKVDYTKVLELMPSGKDVILRAGVGWNKNILVDKFAVDTGKNSQAGYTLISNRPVIVEDLRKEKRFNGPYLLTNHKVISGMSCIIPGEGKPYGVLGIHSKKLRKFTTDDVNFLQAVANVLAMAIQRKSSEERLRESEERYRLVVEHALDLISLLDNKGKILYSSPSFFKLLGYSTDEVAGKNAFELIHPDDTSLTRDGFSKVLEGQTVVLPEFRMKHKDGHYLVMEGAGSAIRDEKGNVTQIVTTSRDISQRKIVEERQRLLSDASNILGTSIDPARTLENLGKIIVPKLADYCRIVVVDENKQIKEITVNHEDPEKIPLVKKLFDAYKDEVNSSAGVGLMLKTGKAEFIHKFDPEDYKGNIKPEILRLTKKLNLRSYMGVPMKIGKNVEGVITFSSSNKNRLYTKEDVELAEELGRRAAFAIANSRLYSDAQKAIAVRDEFISVASHELKTPVTSLKMYTQLLQRKAGANNDSLYSGPLSKMNSQIDKLTVLINDLLNVSKIQHGKLEFEKEEIDINALVVEAVELIRATPIKHKIIINGKVTKKIHADRYRLYQVIANLLTNAIKYSPKSDKVIVKLYSNKNYVKVSVQDFGIGIDKDYQGKIFGKFYRVPSTEERTFPGLGIGLFIASEIVKRHGGTMSLKSVKGDGSIFSFTIPYKYFALLL